MIEGTNPSSWPGEGGRAVVVPSQLQDEAKKRFKENQFNIVASDLMALNRSINDQRSSRFVRFFSTKFPTDSLEDVEHMNSHRIYHRHRSSLYFIMKEIRLYYEH